jgi:hypothetical protein
MSLGVQNPYKKPVSHKMNNLNDRWVKLREFAKAELTSVYSPDLIGVTPCPVPFRPYKAK